MKELAAPLAAFLAMTAVWLVLRERRRRRKIRDEMRAWKREIERLGRR